MDAEKENGRNVTPVGAWYKEGGEDVVLIRRG